MRQNRQITLVSHIHGIPAEEHFNLIATPIPEINEGEILVRNLYFSLEPAIRGWLEGKATYLPPIPLHGVIRGPSVGRVVRSKKDGYREGDIVFGLNRWEDYSVCDSNTVLLEVLRVQKNIPLSYYIGALGGSGATAYIGLHEIGHIKPGQTVVVSAAAGATGSMAGQIAKLRDCRVIGIVGSDEKAEAIVENLGFDAAVNYRASADVTEAIMKKAPDGVDIYFDNVGGSTLNSMLLAMKAQGRIVCCGMIADYNRADNPNPITNLWQVVARQLTIQGFLLPTYHEKVPAAKAQLARWIADGKIKVIEDISRGIANTPKAFCRLMSGKNLGKVMIELDLPEED